MKRWMTIDPGMGGTGLAYFKGSRLIDWGIISKRGTTLEEKTQHIVDHVYSQQFIWQCQRSFIEWPSFQNVIAQNTGSIIKLAFLIGRIFEQLHHHQDLPVLIPVIKWKGNLPKEVTQKRAEKFFGQKGFKSHAADAVGLGQYVIENNLI